MQKVQKYRKAIELLQAEECKPSPQMMFKLSQTLDLDLLLEQADVRGHSYRLKDKPSKSEPWSKGSSTFGKSRKKAMRTTWRS
jgi:hypothetical protein